MWAPWNKLTGFHVFTRSLCDHSSKLLIELKTQCHCYNDIRIVFEKILSIILVLLVDEVGEEPMWSLQERENLQFDLL